MKTPYIPRLLTVVSLLFLFFVILNAYKTDQPLSVVDLIFSAVVFIPIVITSTGTVIILHYEEVLNRFLLLTGMIVLLIITSLLHPLLFRTILPALGTGYYMVSTLSWLEISAWNIAGLFIGFIPYFFQKIQAYYRFKELIVTKELEILQSRLEPHFLFNTVNSVYGLVQSGDNRAADVLHALSGLLRRVLDHRNRDLISLSEEITSIGQFIGIQKIRCRFPDQIRFTTQTGVNCTILPGLFLHLAENCFKHGMPQNSTDKLHITILAERDRIVFSSENTITTTSESVNKTEGSLVWIREILDLSYRDMYQLKTEEKEGIFHLTLTLTQ